CRLRPCYSPTRCSSDLGAAPSVTGPVGGQTDVVAVEPRTELRQQFVADGAGGFGHRVNRDGVANQLDQRTAMGDVLAEVADVERDQVHRDAAGDRQPVSRERSEAAGGTVGG